MSTCSGKHTRVRSLVAVESGLEEGLLFTIEWSPAFCLFSKTLWMTHRELNSHAHLQPNTCSDQGNFVAL